MYVRSSYRIRAMGMVISERIRCGASVCLSQTINKNIAG